MKFTLILTVTALTLMTLSPVQAGSLLRKIEEKKALQAETASSTNQKKSEPKSSAAAPATTNKNDPKFDDAKAKCKKLGNEEGSDKFNNCVVTLME